MIQRWNEKLPVCVYCLKPGHTAWKCGEKAKKKQQMYGNARVASSFGGKRKSINKQSSKEKEYQVWKETVCRPALIKRDGNNCSCCGRPAYDGEKLDIEHTITKGSRPDLKRTMSNLTLMCRIPCHSRKTDGLPCPH